MHLPQLVWYKIKITMLIIFNLNYIQQFIYTNVGIGMQSKETHKLNNNLAQELGVNSPPQQRKCCNVSVNLSQRTFAPQCKCCYFKLLH